MINDFNIFIIVISLIFGFILFLSIVDLFSKIGKYFESKGKFYDRH